MEEEKGRYCRYTRIRIVVSFAYLSTILLRSEMPSEEPSWIVSVAGMISSAVLGVDLTDAKLSAMPENPLTDFNHEVWMTFLSW